MIHGSLQIEGKAFWESPCEHVKRLHLFVMTFERTGQGDHQPRSPFRAVRRGNNATVCANDRFNKGQAEPVTA
jgi:hypothetical protein